MANDGERLARMERRQEAVIQAIGGLADVMRVNNEMLAEVLNLLNQPPSSNLGEVIAHLLAEVTAMVKEIRELPAKVARSVKDGEVD